MNLAKFEQIKQISDLYSFHLTELTLNIWFIGALEVGRTRKKTWIKNVANECSYNHLMGLRRN